MRTNKYTDTNLIMETALKHIKSVPYSVSLRWVFYRLYQQGLYTDKKDYGKKFIGLTARWRKEWKEGWYPGIVVDDTRDIYFHGNGYDNEADWICNLTL